MLLETADEVLDAASASEAPARESELMARPPMAIACAHGAPSPATGNEQQVARLPARATTLAAARDEAKPRTSTLQRLRSSGGLLTVAAGPVAGIVAWRLAGMGAVESFALAFLVSAWIGPKLLSRDWS